MNRSAFFMFAFFGLSVSVSAESLIEGRVRLASGAPVANAQVRIFDMTDLQRGAIARAMTDGTGHFAVPLSALGGSALPQAWTLGQNYPNPFNPSTLIPYQVPTAAPVRLEVFNVLGQRVATLVNEERPAGVHMAAWEATDAAGRAVGAGVYFYRLSSAGQPTLTQRMVLLDGQAGQAAASVPRPMGLSSAPTAEGVYGLSVTGSGLVTYVDASFGVRSGLAPVEVVVEAVEGLPRGKALTDRVLGDVNGDGQVDLADALLITTYVVDGSVELPPNGDLSLGDVNGDGQVDLADAQLLTVYVANPADPSLPAGIGQVVPSGGGDWVTGAVRRLSTAGGWDLSWSPDGQHIAFESWRDGNEEIYVMDADGSNPRRLTTYGGRSPSWSPDGQHIAFESERDGNGEIYVMDADGSNPRRLTTYGGRSPSWSPAGQHIAFSASEDIYVMDSDGSNQRNLTDAWSGDDNTFPSWSPDGQHIAFESKRERDWGDWEIYVMDSDGRNQRNLTNHEADDWSPSWSPDGRHLAFTSDRDGNEEIYVMDSDGRNPRRLTTYGGWSPSWSPDGRHIAFTSDRDGNSNIYVMEIEGGDSSTEMKKDRIVEVLFGLNLGEADAKTYHDYNDYMVRPNDTGDCDGYRGGHSGWDVQTQSVADDKTADEEFYSLTSGEVIAIGGTYNKIAVYNATDDKTTLYLHAREIHVLRGQTVNVGTALGIQGNVGLEFSDPSKDEHVHIEVRDGRSEYASCGAGATTEPINIDPIDYLYEAIQVQ